MFFLSTAIPGNTYRTTEGSERSDRHKTRNKTAGDPHRKLLRRCTYIDTAGARAMTLMFCVFL
jgi:hypothetical protein